MNNLKLVGRLTKTARVGEFDGTAVTNFTVAAEVGLTTKMAQIDGKDVLVQVPATTYIECSAWGPESDAAASLEAGQEVSFEITQLSSKARQYEGKLYSDIVARVRNVTARAKAKAKADAQAPAIPF